MSEYYSLLKARKILKDISNQTYALLENLFLEVKKAISSNLWVLIFFAILLIQFIKFMIQVWNRTTKIFLKKIILNPIMAVLHQTYRLLMLIFNCILNCANTLLQEASKILIGSVGLIGHIISYFI